MMIRCNKSATMVAPNGYRACHEHAWSVKLGDVERIGQCDYPLDDLGAMRLPDREWITGMRS